MPEINIETCFASLEGKESSYEKVEMPSDIVFYPYFEFTSSDKEDSCKANKTSISLNGFEIDKITALERILFPGRHDEYGCWTASKGDETFIGLGAGSLKKLFGEQGEIKAKYVVLKGDDVLYIFELTRKSSAPIDAVICAYVSCANRRYPEQQEDVESTLRGSEILSGETKPLWESAEYTYTRYVYGDEQPRKNCVVCSPKQPTSFKEKVIGCTWHTLSFLDNPVKEGPRFVLLKNPEASMGNILDEVSHWLVHRRGGFVMAEGLASNDFCADVTFCIRQVDVYRFSGTVILNIECETYAKNRDQGFEDFLKNISENRFRR